MKLDFLKNLSHKQKKILIISLSIVVVLIGGAITYAQLNKKAEKPSPKKTTPKVEKVVEQPKPTLIESQLDGTLVSPEIATRHPVAVMIENHPQARPQSGLADANIVYEALAEGGISRFMAIFGTKYPTQAGPVRSARTYYVDWAEEYDAYYTHFGGAADALAKIRNEGVKDLDGMKIGKPLFWRKYYPGVSGSEHTAFTSPEQLYNYSINTKKWTTANSFTIYKFKDDAPAAERPATGTLSVDISGNATYASKYTYDPTTNSYLRFMAGVVHKDRITGAQINPKNIVIQYANEIYKAGKKDHDMQTIGSGRAKYFLDGKMVEGTWEKAASKSRTVFKDAAGAPVTFNRGQTWIAVVKPTAPVTWTP